LIVHTPHPELVVQIIIRYFCPICRTTLMTVYVATCIKHYTIAVAY